MRAFNYFTLITLATLSVACNEKISPKLLDANQSTTVPPVIEPPEYSFKVTNTSPEMRKFHLHKTGIGNYNRPCEIKSTDKFSSNRYSDPARKPEFDITCIFEAEELALEYGGFNIKFEATPNTCEYVGYSPFSFYNYQAGNSSASYTQVTCQTGIDDSKIAGNSVLPIDGEDNRVLCGKTILSDAEIPSSNALPFETPSEDLKLCRYDHSQNIGQAGPNCDIGEITITEIIFSEIPATDTEPARTTFEVQRPRTVKCNGIVSNCISGPIKKEQLSTNQTSVISLQETVKNEPYVATREYERPPFDAGNYYYANFRRNLASPHINYGTQPTDFVDPLDSGYAGFSAYINSFKNQKTYYPLLMENYSAGKSYGGSAGISGLTLTNNLTKYSLAKDETFAVQKSISYSAEPYMGLSDPKTKKSYRTSPYYTFYCLDSAYEIRARIKMVVREWDRFFPTDETSELISDIFNLGNSRIDNPWGIEFPGDLDPINGLNDISDWDDIVPMKRTTPHADGSLHTSQTVWEPLNGFHHTDNFPQFIDQE